MENNNSTVSYPEAYKIYTGRSFSIGVMWLSIASVLFFSAIMLLMMFLMYVDNDSDTVPEPLFGITIASIYGTMLVLTRMMASYDKNIPGGKFFRTVKGGFDTYAKAQKAFIVEGAISLILFCMFLAILDAIGIIEIGNGIGSCIALVITIFLARAIASFSRMIKNSITRMIMIMFVFFVVDLLGVLQIEAFGGKIGLLHVVLAVVTIVLTIISEKAVLHNYRKKYWDN